MIDNANVHISTTSSFRTGIFADLPPSQCSICGHNSMYMDFCGALCDTCGCDIEAPINWSIKRARKRIRVTRKQFAKMTGYAYLTVAKYENSGGSDTFNQRAISVLKKLYSDLDFVEECKAKNRGDDMRKIERIISDFENRNE